MSLLQSKHFGWLESRLTLIRGNTTTLSRFKLHTNSFIEAPQANRSSRWSTLVSTGLIGQNTLFAIYVKPETRVTNRLIKARRRHWSTHVSDRSDILFAICIEPETLSDQQLHRSSSKNWSTRVSDRSSRIICHLCWTRNFEWPTVSSKLVDDTVLLSYPLTGRNMLFAIYVEPETLSDQQFHRSS